MKVTFDHNCLIHLENGGEIGACIRSAINDPIHEYFVVNVGASEMQPFGVRPDNYGAFEELLTRIGIAHLRRLDPIGIWDVTFWDRCVFGGSDDEKLLQSIQAILFPPDAVAGTAQAVERKRLNRLCDALSMWCHISYRNDAFLTTDENFFKATKHRMLVELGAGVICHPCDF